jgi:N utilization substance protein B
MKRRRAREYALQMLFRHEFTGDGPEAFWQGRREEEEVVRFANAVVEGTLKHLDEIDALIKDAAEHWVLERMAAVDRNILRAGVYEIMYAGDIPTAVAINEALEIAKKYSTTESASFINGILDRVAKRKEGA